MHDTTKVLLGVNASSVKTVSSHDADPANFLAGTAVRRSSDDGLVIADDATAALIGVSAGRDMSNAKRTAVFRKGLGIPLLITTVQSTLTVGDLTFTAKPPGKQGDAITIALVDDTQDGSANVVVNGKEIVVNMETTVTTADAIKAAIEASPEANALVSVAVAQGQGAVAQTAEAEAPLANGDDVAVIGEAVQVSDTTGKGVASGDATGAVYASGLLTGVYPDGSTATVALVDMVGGL